MPQSQIPIPPTIAARRAPVGGPALFVPPGSIIAMFGTHDVEDVIAFDHAGNALIMDTDRGVLLRANALPHFYGTATNNVARSNGVAA